MKTLVLGEKVAQHRGRKPEALYPIARGPLSSPMHGYDCWRAYELTWCNAGGKPAVGILELAYPLASSCIIESKSLKLYLGGLADERFGSSDELLATIRQDLMAALNSPWVELRLYRPADFDQLRGTVEISNVDELEPPAYASEPEPSLLKTLSGAAVSETLTSNLLRTFCPITAQPDWGTLTVSYRGAPIDKAALLGYVLSYREHQGFAESCCENIYKDIWQMCRPEWLKVVCHYTRRGGIDITPVRCSEPLEFERQERLIRQ